MDQDQKNEILDQGQNMGKNVDFQTSITFLNVVLSSLSFLTPCLPRSLLPFPVTLPPNFGSKSLGRHRTSVRTPIHRWRNHETVENIPHRGGLRSEVMIQQS
ncbi:hypothetical protein XENOCAPTIV_002363 [Xenoophorus captivus]|uniref:Uncharacterized protein n=1 Tax=Xenoophorus captivus TaxID=1517983 RepID=A0ABV0QZB5_9TELE